MKIRNILMSAALLAFGLTANAQEETKTVFQPHWYIGAQGGAQYSLGEVDFQDLISPNAQVLVGYKFNPVLGLRLAVNGWESKHGLRFLAITSVKGAVESREVCEYSWKNKYIAPNLDLTVSLSNLFAGYNPNRILDLGAFVGVGATVGFDNEAGSTVDQLKARFGKTEHFYRDQNINHNWDGTLLRAQGHGGVYADFRVSKAVSVGLELNANCVSDHYNSKHSNNVDWFFNGLAGVKISLGKSHKKVSVPAPEPKTIVVEKIVEKIVEKPVPVETKAVVERDPLRIDVFFLLSSTKLTGAEGLKIQEIVKYLNKYSDAKVNVTGYADKGTGSAAGNKRLSEKRAAIVVDELVKAGIDPSRITSDSKGDTVQPFDINDLNRVTICIAQ